MTAKTDLPPLPEPNGSYTNPYDGDDLEAYARARVAHAIAPLQAKIDALREELGCLQQRYDERTACVIVHRGSALACSDAMRAAYSDERRRASGRRTSRRSRVRARFGLEPRMSAADRIPWQELVIMSADMARRLG